MEGKSTAQWIADLNLDHLSRFDSYMRAKVGQLYISLFHAYARKNNMWILDRGEALLKSDPFQPAQVVGLIHCATDVAVRRLSSTSSYMYRGTSLHSPKGGL